MKKDWKKGIYLFFYFFRIGFFIFGGGMAIVSQLQRDFVEGKKWVSNNELLDIVGIARSIPGTMITNTAYLFGHYFGGPLAGILCLAGMTLPSVIVLTIVTFSYEYVKTASWFIKIDAGVRAAVVPIIASAAIRLGKSLSWNRPCLIFFILSILISLTGVSRPAIIIICGGFSYFYYTSKRRREKS